MIRAVSYCYDHMHTRLMFVKINVLVQSINQSINENSFPSKIVDLGFDNEILKLATWKNEKYSDVSRKM